MSYTVTDLDDDEPWFNNAWDNIRDKVASQTMSSYSVTDTMWLETYNSTIDLDDKGRWVVSFLSEQDYTWFVLRWS